MSKRIRLADLPATHLVNRYTQIVRRCWEEYQKHNKANRKPLHGGHDPFYQRELAVKREILRRLGVEPDRTGAKKRKK